MSGFARNRGVEPSETSALIVVRPGAFATVQDGGRSGFRGLGVPLGGAYDRTSMALANALVGNPAETPALEMASFGGTYRARGPLALALAGALMPATIESPDDPGVRRLIVPQSFQARDGSVLRIGGTASGARCYLAVGGGFRTTSMLGSRSAEMPLEVGDVLPPEPGLVATCRLREKSPELGRLSDPIRILDGPDADRIVAVDFEGLEYRVGLLADRIGLRLEGPAWPGFRAMEGRTSAPIGPGAIQVAGGVPILLGVACGTMGGYPHVAQVISADLDRIGQLRPGDRLTFRRVGLDEARRVDLESRRQRDELNRMIRFAVGASIDRSSRGLTLPEPG